MSGLTRGGSADGRLPGARRRVEPRERKRSMNAPVKMTDAEIQAALAEAPEWSELNGAIQRTFQFTDFAEAMRFVNRVAAAAEEAQHHPDILIRWNKVTLTLSTHDASGITERDFALAKRVDEMAGDGAEAAEKSGKGKKAKG